jgi:hypothetical protein
VARPRLQQKIKEQLHVVPGDARPRNSPNEVTNIVNHDRISFQAATQQFYAPVYLSVVMIIFFQQDTADMSSSIIQWKKSF